MVTAESLQGAKSLQRTQKRDHPSVGPRRAAPWIQSPAAVDPMPPERRDDILSSSPPSSERPWNARECRHCLVRPLVSTTVGGERQQDEHPPRRLTMRGIWLAMIGVTTAAGRMTAQEHDHQRQTPLYDNLGTYHMPVTTRSPVAQQY